MPVLLQFIAAPWKLRAASLACLALALFFGFVGAVVLSLGFTAGLVGSAAGLLLCGVSAGLAWAAFASLQGEVWALSLLAVGAVVLVAVLVVIQQIAVGLSHHH